MDLIFKNKNIEHPSLVMCNLGLDCVYICWDCIVDPLYAKKWQKFFYAKSHNKNMLKNAKFEVKKFNLTLTQPAKI